MTRLFGWLRAVASPRHRFVPGLGARLGGHPQLAAVILVFLRDLGGERLHNFVVAYVIRPLLFRMAAELDVSVADGFRLWVDTTQGIGRALLTSGMWEPQIGDRFRAVLRPGDVCIDVGANIGYFTLLAAQLVGPRGRVYALEPSPRVDRELLANLELNVTENVTTLQIAAGAEEGEGVLATEAQSIRTKVTAVSEGTQQTEPRVRMRPLAAIVDDDDFSRVRLIKIDVEGAEADVLRGAAGIFESGARPDVVIEVHTGAIEDVADVAAGFCDEYGLAARQLRPEGPADVGTTSAEIAASLEPAYERHLLLTAR